MLAALHSFCSTICPPSPTSWPTLHQKVTSINLRVALLAIRLLPRRIIPRSVSFLILSMDSHTPLVCSAGAPSLTRTELLAFQSRTGHTPHRLPLLTPRVFFSHCAFPATPPLYVFVPFAAINHFPPLLFFNFSRSTFNAISSTILTPPLFSCGPPTPPSWLIHAQRPSSSRY